MGGDQWRLAAEEEEGAPPPSNGSSGGGGGGRAPRLMEFSLLCLELDSFWVLGSGEVWCLWIVHTLVGESSVGVEIFIIFFYFTPIF